MENLISKKKELCFIVEQLKKEGQHRGDIDLNIINEKKAKLEALQTKWNCINDAIRCLLEGAVPILKHQLFF